MSTHRLPVRAKATPHGRTPWRAQEGVSRYGSATTARSVRPYASNDLPAAEDRTKYPLGGRTRVFLVSADSLETRRL